MVIIFDLDDTLYPEITYVESGFNAVATWLYESFGWDKTDSVSFMKDVLEREGRGAIFDRLLKRHRAFTKKLVRDCVRVYRHHEPLITLFPAAASALNYFRDSLYIVTDGHKIVQHKKVQALGVTSRFKKIFVTHRYGLKHAKPSIYCFDHIRKMEGCAWRDMVYIGDDPRKDFVNLNSLGVITVRVLTGMYKNVAAQHGYDAAHSVRCLSELPDLLEISHYEATS